MRAGRSCAALLVGLHAAACQDAPPPVSYAYDIELQERLVAPNPAWPSACGRAPSERIGLPVGLSREQTARPVSAEFAAELADVIDGLPRPFARLFERRVCAVVLMHGAPMSGTLQVLASDPSRGLIFLDVDALNRTANAWMEFKESTPFLLGEQRAIRGKLAEPADDSRRVLLEFVLVHELAHVADTPVRSRRLLPWRTPARTSPAAWHLRAYGDARPALAALALRRRPARDATEHLLGRAALPHEASADRGAARALEPRLTVAGRPLLVGRKLAITLRLHARQPA